MHEKRQAHERDDRELLDELAPQVLDGALDERRPVVDGDDLDATGQPGLELLEPRLDCLDRLPCVLPRAQHDDPADDFAFAVELGDASAHLGPELHACDVSQQHGRAALGHLDRDARKSSSDLK